MRCFKKVGQTKIYNSQLYRFKYGEDINVYMFGVSSQKPQPLAAQKLGDKNTMQFSVFVWQNCFFKRSKLTPAKQTQTTKHGPHTTTVNSVHVAICRYRPDYRNIAALVKNLWHCQLCCICGMALLHFEQHSKSYPTRNSDFIGSLAWIFKIFIFYDLIM